MNYGDGLAQKLSNYTIEKIPIKDILPDPRQPRKRYDTKGIDELAEKMKKHGLISFPLAEIWTGREYKEYLNGSNDKQAKRILGFFDIKDNKQYLVLVVGHRRWLAAKKAGFSHMKLKVLKYSLSILERRTVQIDEDSMVHPPPWQNAKATYNLYKLLVKERREQGIKAEYTIREFSEYLGISESTAREHIRYAKLPQSIKNLVEKQKSISYQNALQVARLHDEKEQLRVISLYGNHPTQKLSEIVSSMLKKPKKESFRLQCESRPLYRELLQKNIKYLKSIGHMLCRTGIFCDIDPDYRSHIRFDGIKRVFDSLSACFSQLEAEINKATNSYLARLERTVPLNGQRQNSESMDNIILKIERGRERRLKRKSELLSEKYLRQIDVRLLKENPKNPRGDIAEEEIDSLAAAIKRDGGLLNPVLVKRQKKSYMIEFGHRRVRAAKRAGLEKIVAFVVDEIPESLALDLQIMENTQVPFSEEERAYGLAQIYDLAGKDSVDSFIAELGISRKTGLRALKYEKCLDPFVKRLVENSLLPYSVALLLVGKEKDEQKTLALAAAANSWTKQKMAARIKERESLKNQRQLFKKMDSRMFEYKRISEEFLFMLKNLKREMDVLGERHKELLKEKDFARAFFRTKTTFDRLKRHLEI